MLHESSNSEPETIKQGEIVFHYIRVRVARVRVIPLVGTKPVTIDKEHTGLMQLHEYTFEKGQILFKTIRPTEDGRKTNN